MCVSHYVSLRRHICPRSVARIIPMSLVKTHRVQQRLPRCQVSSPSCNKVVKSNAACNRCAKVMTVCTTRCCETVLWSINFETDLIYRDESGCTVALLLATLLCGGMETPKSWKPLLNTILALRRLRGTFRTTETK